MFNTTEQLESQHMTRLLMGIISTGAWACFDEFNRIDMEVLSVVAKQILTIQTSLNAGQRYTVFEGRTMFVSSQLAIFITMNPMYEHRSVLPSNLKALFRPVAMMAPDYTLIAQVQLYAAGFKAPLELAQRLVSCLRVSLLATACHLTTCMCMLAREQGMMLSAVMLLLPTTCSFSCCVQGGSSGPAPEYLLCI